MGHDHLDRDRGHANAILDLAVLRHEAHLGDLERESDRAP
jgi:hypothetical protein